MTYPLNDDFADPLGRWNHYAPYDADMYYDDDKGFLTTQSHVDIRTFRVVSEATPRPQTDLEALDQSHWNSPTIQSTMESSNTVVFEETWSFGGSHTGISSAFVVGPIAARGGWPGLVLTTVTNTGFSFELEGTIRNIPLPEVTTPITYQVVDISAMDFVSIILPDYNDLDSFQINFFDINGNVSGVATLVDNLSIMPQFKVAVSDFDNAGFDNTKIKQVQISGGKSTTVAADTNITLMGLRAFASDWEESCLDFDTEINAICVPVTLDGDATDSTVAQEFEFIRGDGSHEDPIPADGAYNIFFFPGGQTSPNDATGDTYNQLAFLLRELKDTGAGTGSIIVAELAWNDTDTTFSAQRIDMTGGAGGTRTPTTAFTYSVGGPLEPDQHYMFRIELTGTSLVPKLYTTAFDQAITEMIWQAPTTLTSSDFVYRNGRVGFMANLVSRDSYVTGWAAAPTGYATLQTEVYPSDTPVDGAQLQAIYSSDINLFSTMSGPDTNIDGTKTISGNGSYRATQAMVSNQFIIDDWNQTYLQLAIWVGVSVSLLNQPQILLNLPNGDTEIIRINSLLANQWNYIDQELGQFSGLVTGVGYSISIQPSINPDRTLGFYWVDSINVGRRRVSWGVRATANGPFREFRQMTNEQDGAVHFNSNERGDQLQLQANALTSDAWVSSFRLFPKYAQLGAPVWDASASS